MPVTAMKHRYFLRACRALRTESFLEFTASDMATREAKQRAVWQAIEASRRGKVVSREKLDEFYARLQVRREHPPAGWVIVCNFQGLLDNMHASGRLTLNNIGALHGPPLWSGTTH